MRTDTVGGLQSARDEILKNIYLRQLQQVIDKLGTLSTDVSDALSNEEQQKPRNKQKIILHNYGWIRPL